MLYTCSLRDKDTLTSNGSSGSTANGSYTNTQPQPPDSSWPL